MGIQPKRMGKYKDGSARIYLNRRAAIKKSRLSLGAFRRLCIYKGIYPQEPNNYKAAGKGNTARKQYFLKRDVNYIMRDPLYQHLFKEKVFLRKLKKYEHLKLEKEGQLYERNRPILKLDHVVKERYPRFELALRDLDDCLTHLRLISKMCAVRYLDYDVIDMAKRLTTEFLHYVIVSKSLRKVFVSIKGVYMQANVHGETITWIEPYNFTYESQNDVDFRVMHTFTDFYVFMLGFVNYKLYTDCGMSYPPLLKSPVEPKHNLKHYTEKQIRDEQLECLTQCLEIGTFDEPETLDEIPTISNDKAEIEADQVKEETEKKQITAIEKQKTLFKGLKFFLGREIMRQIVTFIIRSFSGEVSWDDSSCLGATFPETDQTITHQIVDRPKVEKTYLTRYYIQPQWVFDSVNAGELLPVDKYFPGAVLPPHLSPFASDEDYQPPEARPELNKHGEEDDSDLSEEEEFIDTDGEYEEEDGDILPETDMVGPGSEEESDSEEEVVIKKGKNTKNTSKAKVEPLKKAAKAKTVEEKKEESEEEDESEEDETEEDESEEDEEESVEEMEIGDSDSDLESFEESDVSDREGFNNDKEDEEENESEDDFVDMDKCHPTEGIVDMDSFLKAQRESRIEPLPKDFKTFDLDLSEPKQIVPKENKPDPPTKFQLKFEVGHQYQSPKEWILYVQGRQNRVIDEIVQKVSFVVDNKKPKAVHYAPYRILRTSPPQEATIKILFRGETKPTTHKYTVPAYTEKSKAAHILVKQLFSTNNPEFIGALEEAGATRMDVSTGQRTVVTQQELEKEAREHKKIQEMLIPKRKKFIYNKMMKGKKYREEAKKLLEKKRKVYDADQKKQKKKRAKELVDKYDN